MNSACKVIWSHALQQMVVVSEIVSSRGKAKSVTQGSEPAGHSSESQVSSWTAKTLASTLALAFGALTAVAPALAQTIANTALPTGGSVAAGSATINSSGANMVIDQASQRAVINWQSFNVGQDAHVHFNNAGGSTLNRVTGPEASTILGRITAPGQVIISNGNGVFFGRGSMVDVGSLIATTHGISNERFMAGDLSFERNGSTASVVNEGELRAKLEGYIALIAPEVRNQGLIVATKGTIALAAGELVELQLDPNNKLTNIRVEAGQWQALVDNRHAIEADGGLVILSAMAARELQAGVVRNSGSIQANGLQRQGGRIILSASHQVENTGSLSANATAGATAAESGPAGNIEISAPEVVNSGSISATGLNSGSTQHSAGSVRVQATHFTQTASGSMDLSAPTQGGQLKIETTGNVSLQGSVNVQATQDRTHEGTATQGGTIDIAAQGDIEVDSAQVSASGGQGGSIHLRAAAEGQPDNPHPLPSTPDAPGQGRLAIMGQSALSTRGRSGQGGSTTLLGDHIELLGTTAIDATGATGGGKVLVGGDWQGGANAERRVFDDPNALHQATTVTMEQGTHIDASATDNGKGGTVVLWADITNTDSVTRANGSIDAKGGQNGGDGGQIETSGRYLNVNDIQVSTLATMGQTGEWLLDPHNIVIGSSGGSSYTAISDNTFISASTLQAALASNNITVYTGTTGAQAGNITVSATITSSSIHNLVLKAANNIVIDANITRSGTGGLTLRADSGSVSGLGTLILGGGTTLALAHGTTLSNNISLTTGGVTIRLADLEIDYLVVGGGGGGGARHGGGGGGGGVQEGSISLSSSFATVAVGAGGAGGPAGSSGSAGSSSSITFGGNSITASGGLGGIRGGNGGASGSPQNNAGGQGGYGGGDFYYGGGGGGAGAAVTGTGSTRRHGADGYVSWITGQIYGGGGGGGSISGPNTASLGGAGGGALGGFNNRDGQAGVNGLGGGGGGGGVTSVGGNDRAGGAGGSGVVIIRYAGPAIATGGDTVTQEGNYRLHTFTTTGTTGFSVTGNLVASITGTITGTGNLSVDASKGVITLSGNNNYSGSTSISNGIVRANNTSALGNQSAVSLATSAGTQLELAQNLTVGSISGGNLSSSVINLGAHILTTGSNNSSTTFSGNIFGTGQLQKVGSGTLVLGGNNTYTGATAINGGTLVLQNNAPNPSNKTFNGTGALRIEPSSASFTSAFSTSGWTFSSTLSGLTLGKDGNTQAITVASAISIGGPIAIYGGNITLNAGLTASGTNTITLKGGSTSSITHGANGFVNAGNLLLLGGSTITLNSTNNAIGTLAASGVGNVSFINSSALTVGSVDSTHGVTATGAINVGTYTGSLTVTKNITTQSASATALTLNASINSAVGADLGSNLVLTGSPTISVGSGGIGRLFTGSIASSSSWASQVGVGSASGRFRFNADETTNFNHSSRAALLPGLNLIYREQPTATVTFVSADARSMAYGDTIPLLNGAVSGVLNGDTPTYSVAGRVNSSTGNIIVGQYALTEVSLAKLGYNVTINAASDAKLTVVPKVISLTGLLVANKTYDGTTVATITSYGSLSGLVQNGPTTDAVTLATTSAALNFDTALAGNNKTVTIAGLSLSGTDASNYIIGPQTSTASIHKAALTVTGLTANNKVYDRSAVATISTTGLTLQGLVASDAGAVTLSNATGAFDTANVGVGKTVTLSYSLTGEVLSNYTVTHQTTTTGNITPATLTLNGATGLAKTYDGSVGLPSAHLGYEPAALLGVLSGDTVTVVGNAVFASANVARDGNNPSGAVTTQAIVQGTVALTGVHAGNYTLVWTDGSGTINPAPLTVRANNDAKFVSTADPTFTVSYTGFVAGQNASVLTTAPTVSVDRTISGLQTAGSEVAGLYDDVLVPSGAVANNYAFTYVKGSYAIVPADQLLVRMEPAATTYGDVANYTVASAKYYGQTGTATVKVTTLGTGTDVATVTVDAGAEKFVVGDVIAATGGSGTGLKLRVESITGNGTIASLSVVSDFAGSGYAVNDVLTLQYGREVSVDASVSNNQVTLTDMGGKTAVFTAAALSPSFSTAQQLAAGAYQLGIAGTVVEDSPNFTNLVTVVGVHEVAQKQLTTSVLAGATKTYDGTSTMTGLSLGLTGVVTGTPSDVVSVFGSGQFSDKHVSRDNGALAANKSYSIVGLTLSGADAANYFLSSDTLTGTNGQITPKTLDVTYTGIDRIYNGLTEASVSTADNRIAGDSFSITRTANFVSTSGEAAKNVLLDSHGNPIAKTISITGISLTGADALNYTVASTGSASATITQASLVVTGITGVDKTYNRTNEAFLSTSNVQKTGLIGDDVVNLTATGVYAGDGADAYNAGLAKSITITSSYTGADVNNYLITSQTSTTASILRRPVSVSASGGVSKVYDGTTAMLGVSITVAGVSGVAESGVITIDGITDVVTVSGLGNFDTPDVSRDDNGHVLSNKTYTLSDLQLGGASAQNYMIVGGATSLSGSNGRIDPKVIEVSSIQAEDKFYDGNTAAVLTGGFLIGVVGADDVTITGQVGVFANKNVGGQTVSISGIALGGDKKDNYTLSATTATATASIHRQSSVTWVGGSTGDWFNPNNWALTSDLNKTGAVPDLANVATVVIPIGTTVNFNTTAVGLAEANAPVNIDQILGTGATLGLSAGTLNVGAGGMSLLNYTQSSGTLINAGTTTLGSFSQSGGSFSTTGSVTITNSFEQTAGTFTTSGADAHVNITQASTLTWFNIDVGGNLTLTSAQVNFGQTRVRGNLLSTTSGAGTAGGVLQTAMLEVDGSATFEADTGLAQDALLTRTNDFKGLVNFRGVRNGTWRNISLVDESGITLGDIDAGGDLIVDAVGNIDQDSTGGKKIVVGGDTDLTADGDITLDGPGNDFKGTVNADGNNITLQDDNDITLGDIDAGGDLVVDAGGNIDIKGDVSAQDDLKFDAGGNITQDDGSSVTVGGDTDLTADGDITLDGPGNDFKGTVNADGNNITLQDDNDIALGDINADGDLIVDAGGDIDVQGDVSADEDMKFDAGGSVTQDDGSSVKVGGDTDISAGGDITLDGPGNDFRGTVNADGNNITLQDDNDITLGDINAEGDLIVDAGGDVIQDKTPPKKIVVRKETTIDAGGDIELDGEDNDFQDTFNGRGGNIKVVDKDDFKFGDVHARKDNDSNGDLFIRVGGDITQDTTNGKKIVVDGKTELIADGQINLPGDNQFKDGVKATGRPVFIRGDVKADEAKARAEAQRRAATAAAAAAAAAAASSSSGASARLPEVTTNMAGASAVGPDAVSRAAGGESPVASAASTSGVEIELLNQPELSQSMVVAVTLPADTSTTGSGFVFSLPAELKDQMNGSVRVALADGNPLPGWLVFNQATGEFSATAVPDRAFPIQVVLSWGGQQVMVVISEKQS